MSNKSGLPGLANKAKSLFDKPELWLVKSVLVASIISVIYYSGDKAKDTPTQAILIFLGVAAVGFHYLGAKNACRAWYERQGGAFIAWAMVICGAITWEVNSQMGIASQNQANLLTAQLTAATKSDDARGNVALWEGTVKRLNDERSAMKPASSAGQARATIDTSEAHKFFRSTDSCKVTKGAQTRKFCEAYFSAQADLKMWDDIGVYEGKLANANAKLEEARSASAAAPVVASAERADFRNLKRLTGLNDQDLELSQSLLLVLVMALFLTVAGWLIKAEEYEGKARRPWFRTSNMRARIYAWLTGNEDAMAAANAGPGAVIYHTKEIRDEGTADRIRRAVEAMHEKRNQMAAA